tara:strand:- start:257 stop:508 length:252 start_codon:yes stop_codon:yes gene_type:complete
MDPETLLMEILESLNDMSDKSDYNDWSVEEIVTHVENYEEWLRKGGFKPDFQDVVEKWLTDKQDDVKNSPDKKQKQFWYGAEL